MADWSDEREGMTGSLEAPSAGLEVPLLPRPEEFLDHDAFGVAVEGGNDMADLLDDLRALEDLEHGGPAGMDFIDEVDDVYKMKELIEEKPRDVIQYIEEEGTIKLGEFDVQDTAVKVFSSRPLLTAGHEHLDCDWEGMWRDVLNDKMEAAHTGLRLQAGWNTSVCLEAHAVKIRDAAAPGSRGLLQPLLKRYQARGCPVSVFGLPAVQAVIHFKWSTWASRLLGFELSLYAVWLLSFITFSLLFESEDPELTLLQLLATPTGCVAVVCDAVGLLAMLPFLYMEVCTIMTYGTGWLNLWNSLDVLTYILQMCISVLHLMRCDLSGNWFSVMVAAQHLMLWSKMHYYARVFNPTKNLLADTFLLVLDDTKWFLLYVLLIMLGFMFAFFSLFRQDRNDVTDFKTLWHAFASMFAYLLAMFDLNVLYNSTNPTAAMILFIIYEFIVNIMLLNIMIAIMARSFDKVNNDQGLRFLSSRAQIIDELESTLPRWLIPKGAYPPFVHILKVAPGSTYEVNLGSMWSSMGLMEDNLLSAQRETRRRLEQMEADLAQANGELDMLIGTMMDLAARPAAYDTPVAHEHSGLDHAGSGAGHPSRVSQLHRDHHLHHQATWPGPVPLGLDEFVSAGSGGVGQAAATAGGTHRARRLSRESSFGREGRGRDSGGREGSSREAPEPATRDRDQAHAAEHSHMQDQGQGQAERHGEVPGDSPRGARDVPTVAGAGRVTGRAATPIVTAASGGGREGADGADEVGGSGSVWGSPGQQPHSPGATQGIPGGWRGSGVLRCPSGPASPRGVSPSRSTSSAGGWSAGRRGLLGSGHHATLGRHHWGGGGGGGGQHQAPDQAFGPQPQGGRGARDGHAAGGWGASPGTSRGMVPPPWLSQGSSSAHQTHTHLLGSSSFGPGARHGTGQTQRSADRGGRAARSLGTHSMPPASGRPHQPGSP